MFDGLHIDFGFSAAGDAVEQECLVMTGVESGLDLLESESLIGGEGGRSEGRIGRGEGRAIIHDLFGGGDDETTIAEGLDGAVGAMGEGLELIGGEGLGSEEELM